MKFNVFTNKKTPFCRKLETEELQKIQLQNQLDRATDRISRLESDNEFLRTQLKLQDSPNANFEKFYILELEKKLEAHRTHESKLAKEIQLAQNLVKDLQQENSDFLTREKELVNQVERLTDQNLPSPLDSPQNESSSKINNLLAINEALQGKIRLLENRIARLQDDLQENANMSQAENLALMIRQQHKKTKPVRKIVHSVEKTEIYSHLKKYFVKSIHFTLFLLTSYKVDFTEFLLRMDVRGKFPYIYTVFW